MKKIIINTESILWSLFIIITIFPIYLMTFNVTEWSLWVILTPIIIIFTVVVFMILISIIALFFEYLIESLLN